MAFVYGTLYRKSLACIRSRHELTRFNLVFLTTLPGIFEGTYHERVGIAGLNYFALGIGLTGASQVNARVMDRIYIYFTKKNGGKGRPEYRLRT